MEGGFYFIVILLPFGDTYENIIEGKERENNRELEGIGKDAIDRKLIPRSEHIKLSHEHNVRGKL